MRGSTKIMNKNLLKIYCAQIEIEIELEIVDGISGTAVEY
jgi:hypothetical protein